MGAEFVGQSLACTCAFNTLAGIGVRPRTAAEIGEDKGGWSLIVGCSYDGVNCDRVWYCPLCGGSLVGRPEPIPGEGPEPPPVPTSPALDKYVAVLDKLRARRETLKVKRACKVDDNDPEVQTLLKELHEAEQHISPEDWERRDDLGDRAWPGWKS